MKRTIAIVILGALAFHCLGQPATGSFVASVSGTDRMAVMKSSMDLPSWHEKSFWPLYEKYLNKLGETSMSTYRALDDLARLDRTASSEEALAHAQKLLAFRNDELAVRKQYFDEIGSSFNGIIALQFLQTEALLDMMESAGIYEATVWKKYRFQPNALSPENMRSAKYAILSKAIALPEQNAQDFYLVYAQYEIACDALLGEHYSLYGLYAGEAGDFTPALAKQLGHNLLLVMQRENKLKEKYFNEMNNAVGPVLAARFLAWEDYYSLISKMYAWADAP